MGHISTINEKRKTGTFYDLLCEGADLSWDIIRLKEEADRVYQPASRLGQTVMGIHERTESYIERSSKVFQKMSELDVDASIVGDLSLTEMRRRRACLDERIALKEAQGNVIPFKKQG